MTICERMFEIIEHKQLKTADLAKKLNIRQSVITNWKKRNTNPPIEYILVICEFLGITVEEFITGLPDQKLSAKEKELIEAYQRADAGTQKIVRKILDIPEDRSKSSDYQNGKVI